MSFGRIYHNHHSHRHANYHWHLGSVLAVVIRKLEAKRE